MISLLQWRGCSIDSHFTACLRLFIARQSAGKQAVNSQAAKSSTPWGKQYHGKAVQCQQIQTAQVMEFENAGRGTLPDAAPLVLQAND